MQNILTIIFGTAVGFSTTVMFLKNKKLFNFEQKAQHAKTIIEESKAEAIKMKEETQIKAKAFKEKLINEINNKEERLKKINEILTYKEEVVNKKQERNNEIKLRIASLNEDIQSKENLIKKTERETSEKLTEKTGLNKEELKNSILNNYEKELEEENLEKLANIEESLKENALKTARSILINTIQRMSSPTSVESKVTLINVPKDHIKGKIVGKNAQNIEELEKLLDVEVVFNDLPNTISVSSYSLTNRRIAQKTIEKLINIRTDITASEIKKAIIKSENEIEEEFFAIGQRALKQLNIQATDHDLIKTIGRLEFRTSYGQNIMKHSMEVAWAAMMIASELSADVNVCRIAGFLHDLGKAIDQDPNVQGAHDFLTKELMEKYKFSEAEVHAAWTHHDSAPAKTAEAMIVKAADAISAGRPGARQESLDRYIERLQALEHTANAFAGVQKSFAISAGRELRVIVDPETIKDENMVDMANQIAKEIETNLTYPGKIKVNVIRRIKYTELAK